ncbi:MAG: hypothetical protein HY376_00890 [Candidatus Blackburnbacteria bacterium]|nr:hypothetical protein [Candidatus Blackburnbacteria bacterium]
MAVERILFQLKQDLLIRAADVTEKSLDLSRDGQINAAQSQVEQAHVLLAQARSIDGVNYQVQTVFAAAGLQDPPIDDLRKLFLNGTTVITTPQPAKLTVQKSPAPVESGPVTPVIATPRPAASPEHKSDPVDPKFSPGELLLLAKTISKKEQFLGEIGAQLQPQDRDDVRSFIEKNNIAKHIPEDESLVRDALERKLIMYIQDKKKVFSANSTNVEAVTLLALVVKLRGAAGVKRFLDTNDAVEVVNNDGLANLPLKEKVKILRNRGMGNKDIAQELGASENVVSAYASQLIASGEIEKRRPGKRK